jgi:hypothetical protein
MRRAIALLAMVAALAAPAFAEEPADQQILGLALGQRAPDPSDTGGVQAAFGPVIANNLKGLILVETGAPHYLLDLGNDHMLGIWFDGTSKDRPIYWLDLTQKFEMDELGKLAATNKTHAVAEARQIRSDFDIAPLSGWPLGRIKIGIDAALADERKAKIKRDIDDYLTMHSPTTDTTFAEFPPNDPRFRLELLGEQFRGRMVSLYGSGSFGIDLIETELFDGTLARDVLARPVP